MANMEFDIDEVIFEDDKEYMRECLTRTDISNSERFELLIAIDDIELIKEYVSNSNLSESEKVGLIAASGNKEYMKACVKDPDLDLDEFDQAMLITEIEDPDFSRQCLTDPDLHFEPLEKRRILLGTEDIRYIRAALQSEEFGTRKARLSEERTLSLVVEYMKNPDKIKQFIADEELRNDKTLVENESVILGLILRTKDEDYIKECIDNKELNLSETSRFVLNAFCEGTEYVEEYFKNIKIEKKLDLPENMTIGMEIESEGPYSDSILEYFDYGNWKSQYEPSIEGFGVEVVSPIMTSTQENTRQIYVVNSFLKAIEQGISEFCGGHIHIGADALKSKQAYINLMEIYCNTEKSLYVISNEEGVIPREGFLVHATMIADGMKSVMEKGTVEIKDEAELDGFISKLQELQENVTIKSGYDNRSVGLNLLNVNNIKNTIEFRFPNGTLAPNMWIDNINLLGSIMATAQELAEIQTRGDKTDEEKYKLDLLSKLKTPMARKEKLEVMLELIGVESEEYIKRYDVNIELIKQDEVLGPIFEEEDVIVDFSKPDGKINIVQISETTKNASAIKQQQAEVQIIKAHKNKSRVKSRDSDKVD